MTDSPVHEPDGVRLSRHYTYADPERRLLQGDILKKSAALAKHIETTHPEYAQEGFATHFLVLTQSCDLVDRGQGARAECITICAVRPLVAILRCEAKKYQDWWQEPCNILDNEAFDSMVLFVESLIDNNQPRYFYLHADAGLGVVEAHCAVLALAVPLSTGAIEGCLDAKVGQLMPEFRAKLGWLVGDMYSRVGTAEWVEHYADRSARQEASKQLGDAFKVLSKRRIGEAVSELAGRKKLDEYSPSEIQSYLTAFKPLSSRERFRVRAEEVLQSALEKKHLPDAQKHARMAVGVIINDAQIQRMLESR